jgi:hypothetical protein
MGGERFYLNRAQSKRILLEQEFRKLGESLYLHLDDGSQGFNGKAPELLCHL